MTIHVAPIYPLVAKVETKSFKQSRTASLGKIKVPGPECRKCHLEIHVPNGAADVSDVIRRHCRGLSCKRNAERYRMREKGLWQCPNKGMMLTQDFLGFDLTTFCTVEKGKYAVYTEETVASFVGWLFANNRKVTREDLSEFLHKSQDDRHNHLHGIQLEFEIQQDQANATSRGF